MKKIVIPAVFVLALTSTPVQAWRIKSLLPASILSKLQTPSEQEVPVVVPVVEEVVLVNEVVPAKSCCLSKYLPGCPAMVSNANNSVSSLIAAHPKVAVALTVVATVVVMKLLEKFAEEEEVLF